MVAKLMLPCLGNGQQEHIYLKTMSNITRRQSFWKHVAIGISVNFVVIIAVDKIA